MDKPLKEFLEQYKKKVAGLEKRKHIAYFNAAVTGNPRFFEEYANLEIEHTRLLSKASDFSFLESVTKSKDISKPILKRQAKVLHHVYKAHQLPTGLQEEIIQLETRIANKFSVFRAEAGGRRLTDNQMEEVLASSADSQRVRTVWEASKLVGALVEADVRQLVSLRNKAANLLGYPDYHQMSLQLSEQDPGEVNALFDHLDDLTREGFSAIKERIDHFLSAKFGLPANGLRPWHYQDRFFQEAPSGVLELDLDPFYAGKDLVAITANYFRGIHLPVDDLLKNSDLFEKPGKNQHAFCIHIDRYGDVRVLCNLKLNRRWMNTLLHEYGHAVYEKYYAAGLPFVLREPAHIFVTEAVAMFFGRLASNPMWMHEMGIISLEKAGKLIAPSRDYLQMEQLVFSRWVQVMYRFEQSMYARPEQDLNRLWWELVQRYQQLTPPDDIRGAHWASKIHVATAPCYYHNYLLGELLASQFYAHIGTKVLSGKGHQAAGYSHLPEIGRFFREKVFADGASMPWQQLIRKAAGQDLDPGFYAREFTA